MFSGSRGIDCGGTEGSSTGPRLNRLVRSIVLIQIVEQVLDVAELRKIAPASLSHRLDDVFIGDQWRVLFHGSVNAGLDKMICRHVWLPSHRLILHKPLVPQRPLPRPHLIQRFGLE